MFKYQNNRNVRTQQERKMSSLNVCQKLSREYLYFLDKNNVIILQHERQMFKTIEYNDNYS